MSYNIKVLPSGHEFSAEGDETILDAALRSGLAFPYGCRGGACGACIGKILSGEISYGDDEPMALSEEQADAGMSLFCVARPLGDLTIEIHEHITSLGDVADHFALESAVEIAVNFCVFEELALARFGFELLAGHEEVVDSILLAGTGIAGRCRDGVSSAFVLI